VTGTRADYGLLSPLLRRLAADARVTLQVLVTGSHLSQRFGETWREIAFDGFAIDSKVAIPLEDDSPAGVAGSMGATLAGIGAELTRLGPDVVLVLGDRYEALAAAIAATLANVPVAHIHGGELTEGSTDDAFRHAITKLSSLHFPSTAEYARRIVQLGESPASVVVPGALGVDNALNTPLLGKSELESDIGFEFGERSVVLTYHPVTLAADGGMAGLVSILAALDALGDAVHVLVTAPNADVGNAAVRAELERWVGANAHRAVLVESLGRVRYLSAVSHASAVLGNSSSGVIEAPSLGTPAVDVGDRQRGRIRGPGVIHSEPVCEAVVAALEVALTPEHRERMRGESNPYGDGHAAERIAAVLAEQADTLSARKTFFDLAPGDGGCAR